jgi:hypothetical protein
MEESGFYGELCLRHKVSKSKLFRSTFLKLKAIGLALYIKLQGKEIIVQIQPIIHHTSDASNTHKETNSESTEQPAPTTSLDVQARNTRRWNRASCHRGLLRYSPPK